jgi:deoxyribodipyrimidine photolyase-related protein
MREARPTTHDILMVRSEAMIRSRRWHAQRLHLVLSAAAHHAHDLRSRGFTLHEIVAPTVARGIEDFRRAHPATEVVATAPRSRPLHDALTAAGVRLTPDDSFLTPRSEVLAWPAGRLPLMETFYRRQRARLGILMVDGQPEGGRWNFDADNRTPPPRGPHPWPEPLHHGMDDVDRRVWAALQDADTVGTPPSGIWPTTRAGALRQLAHFVNTGLAGFGPYEDAVPADTWTVYHSLLSPALNLGLLDPDEVLDAALARYAEGGIPLASIEAFARQVAGWREFVNGVYWSQGPEYALRNDLGAEQPLPPAFDDPERTRMQCVRATLSDVHARGWVHHIPRLMILANLALIAGVVPQALLGWMRRMFVDAADWVMVPNVIGMGAHADGGTMMSKPYAAGGAYLSRMTRHCGSCPFDPKARTGPTACPFTTLYWDFLDRHQSTFSRNPRMSAQVASARRLADLDDVRRRAREVRGALAVGEL